MCGGGASSYERAVAHPDGQRWISGKCEGATLTFPVSPCARELKTRSGQRTSDRDLSMVVTTNGIAFRHRVMSLSGHVVAVVIIV